MKKLQRWMMLLLFPTSSAYAQEAILEPFNAHERPVHVEAEASSALDDATRWVTLQRDLYRVVLTFDAASKAFEKTLLSNDRARLAWQEQKMRHPEAPLSARESGIEPSSHCAELEAALTLYIDKHTPELDRTIQSLLKRTQTMTEEDRRAFAEKIRVALSGEDTRRGEEILYLCLYKMSDEYGVALSKTVEKALRRWMIVQMPLLEAWLGDVE